VLQVSKLRAGLSASYQQKVCAMAGLCVLITFGFFINIVSWDKAQLVGLGIPLRFIAKPSYARHCTNPNVVRKRKKDSAKHVT
jgi:hypothetical protein